MTLFLWLALGEWRAQPVRNALSVIAIAVGVALGFGVHLVNEAALDRFETGMNRARGAADLRIVAADGGSFDEMLYGQLMDRAGPAAAVRDRIATASPIVERDVAVRGLDDVVLHVVGLDPLQAAAITPESLDGAARGADEAGDDDARAVDWLADDAIFVPQGLLDLMDKRPGGRIDVVVDDRPVRLRIAGRRPNLETGDPAVVARRGPTRRFEATMDIAAAQWRLGRLGRLTRIDVRLVEGSDVAAVSRALAAWLPPNVRLTTAGDDAARSGDLSRAYRVNLDMLALMALFTGAFLVYSTQTLAVARRRAQIALLRVTGVVRGRVVGQVVAEGIVEGIVGGLVGLALGVGLAALALQRFGGDLGGGYFTATSLSVPGLIRAAPQAAMFFALGLVAAVAGSLLPARAATREAPARALKSTSGDAPLVLPRPWLAVVLVAAGVAATFAPAVEGLPIVGYVAMALLLFGGISAMPWIARALLAPLARARREWPVPIQLALRRLWAAPSAASVALCGIVASASLMVAMTVMIASFRHSVDEWLHQILSADLYLRSNAVGSDEGLDAARLDKIAALPGVARVDAQKVVPLTLSPSRPPVALIVRTVDDDPRTSLPLIRTAAVPAGAIPVWVSEAVVELYGATAGRPIDLPLVAAASAAAADAAPATADAAPSAAPAPARPSIAVAGVWRDYARQFGSVAIRRADYERLTGDRRYSDAAITLAPGASARAVTDGIRALLPDALRGRAEFAQPAEIRALSLSIFDRSFAVTYVLQAVAIAIGLAGIAATFSAQTLSRAKEFGMLRHIGVDRSQVLVELAAEGALLGFVGALAGGLVGLALSQVLIHVVNPQSFHWTMDTWIPWRTLAIVGVALVVASSGTAVVAGRRATTRASIVVVREDW